MPVNRIVHLSPETVVISEPFTRIEKNSGAEIIITDLIVIGISTPISQIILNKRSGWLHILNGVISVLEDAPATLPANMFQHNNWALSQLVRKDANLHVIHYDDPGKTHRDELVSYEPSNGASDQIIVFIDQTNDFCKIYFD